MKKERIISIILIIAFCVTLLVAIKFELFNNFIPQGDSRDTANKKNTETEMQPPSNQGSNPYSKGDKVLDDTYMHGMNEEIYLKSTYGAELNLKVTDSYLTRDITEYYNLISDEIYYNEQVKEHVDSNGVIIDDYYYAVACVTITNIGTEKGECLIPGMFRYTFLKDNMTPSSPASIEIRYAAKTAGKGGLTFNGHLISEAGESYTFALIAIVSEADLNKYADQGKECYLGTSTSDIHEIPKDENKVKFIKLDFLEK